MRTFLFNTIYAAMKNPFKVIQHFIRLYAGLIAAAQRDSDANAVSYTVENIVENYEREYTKAVKEHDENVWKWRM